MSTNTPDNSAVYQNIPLPLFRATSATTPENHHVGSADQPPPQPNTTPLLNMPGLLTKGRLLKINQELRADNQRLAQYLVQQAVQIKELLRMLTEHTAPPQQIPPYKLTLSPAITESQPPAQRQEQTNTNTNKE